MTYSIVVNISVPSALYCPIGIERKASLSQTGEVSLLGISVPGAKKASQRVTWLATARLHLPSTHVTVSVLCCSESISQVTSALYPVQEELWPG